MRIVLVDLCMMRSFNSIRTPSEGPHAGPDRSRVLHQPSSVRATGPPTEEHERLSAHSHAAAACRGGLLGLRRPCGRREVEHSGNLGRVRHGLRAGRPQGTREHVGDDGRRACDEARDRHRFGDRRRSGRRHRAHEDGQLDDLDPRLRFRLHAHHGGRPSPECERGHDGPPCGPRSFPRPPSTFIRAGDGPAYRRT